MKQYIFIYLIFVPIFIQAGSIAEEIVKEVHQEFYQCVQEEFIDGIAVLVREGVHNLYDINVQNSQGKTPLMIAIGYKDNETVRALIKGTAITGAADLDLEDNNHNTAIMYAHRFLNFEAEELLREVGVELPNILKDQETVLLRPYKKRNGVPVLNNHTQAQDKYSLIQAVERNNLDAVVKLLDNNVDVSGQDKRGFTPLQRACFLGHKEIVRELLTVDKLENYPEGSNWRPLDIALLFKYFEIAEILGYQRNEEGLLTEENIKQIKRLKRRRRRYCEILSIM